MKEISVEELKINPSTLIGKEWALLTAGNKDGYNTMTVSWGQMGDLWNKPTTVVYIRPQRYTKEFVDKSDYYTLSFLPDGHREALSYLGSHSGRDEDKLAKTDLTGTAPDDYAYRAGKACACLQEAVQTAYDARFFYRQVAYRKVLCRRRFPRDVCRRDS